MTVVFAGKPGAPGVVLARGSVVDVGTLTPNDSDTDTLTFRDGTVLIEESGDTDFQPPAAPACVARFTTTGTYTVIGGSGRFAHAAGNGTSRDSGIEWTSRTPGGCAQSGLFVYDEVQLRGTLSIR